MPAPVLHRPGPEPGTVLLAHATGFCKEIWLPVIDELRTAGEDRTIVAWDAPGHGDAGPFPSAVDWWEVGRSALAALGDAENGVVGVGHSMGGAALVLAELLRPGTFERLVLIEPIIFPPPFRVMEDMPLATLALRRRAFFESAAAAYTNYHHKAPFSSWDERSLRAYVEYCFREEGEVWSLKCRPEVEADVYRAATAHGAFARLGEIQAPVLVIVGAETTTYPQGYAMELAARFAEGSLHSIERGSHFLPMEHPARVAEEVIRFAPGGRSSDRP